MNRVIKSRSPVSLQIKIAQMLSFGVGRAGVSRSGGRATARLIVPMTPTRTPKCAVSYAVWWPEC